MGKLTVAVRRQVLTTGVGQKVKARTLSALADLGYELREIVVDVNSVQSRFVREFDITRLIDVGANQGQYARQFRARGFNGRMDSFEPNPAAAVLLSQVAAADVNWFTHGVALGAIRSRKQLLISANSVSSSFLELENTHLASEPMASAVRSEVVEVETMDAALTLRPGERCWLKIDVQGFELEVLAGAEATLQQCPVVQLEASLIPLYKGEPSLRKSLDFMHDLGYTSIDLQPGFRDKQTGHLLQADIIFGRK